MWHSISYSHLGASCRPTSRPIRAHGGCRRFAVVESNKKPHCCRRPRLRIQRAANVVLLLADQVRWFTNRQLSRYARLVERAFATFARIPYTADTQYEIGQMLELEPTIHPRAQSENRLEWMASEEHDFTSPEFAEEKCREGTC
jgi:hypothetical protein